ncbi:MAG: bifunctional demethylmenaquinone methyltransferase/2-methoxy-6-polyprenyl-1,4-benzoquinol methylase UbiE [Bacteroidales bacterium]|nr:bifunctional demethylmenaquinone methyltransferase/2-methoxy-6-polyprenyl-1,4-benzoquinol methylase UbiE [Bacteroidales bacterium]
MPYDFDKIARTYDRLNRMMTLGLDRRWRKRAVSAVKSEKLKVKSVLDVACGTGDMVRELQKHGCHVTGVDLSEEMLIIAKSKAPTVTYMIADAEHLPFENDCFDAVTCAFGVRNFVHLEQGLSEMLRVLKPGGRMVILELSTPDSPLIRPFYNLYAKHIIPWLGSRIAGNREAYTYLPESIERFPKGEAFLGLLGDPVAEHTKYCFGVCRMYVINKEAAR